MFRTPIACMLILLAASPASAQLAASACWPHRNDEVRCAARVDIPVGTRFDVTINATRAGAEARMQADTYVSICGSRGRMVGRTNIPNSGTSRVATFTHEPNMVEHSVQSVVGFCVEVFLVNCTVAGRPESCTNALRMGPSRVELNWAN